MKKWKLLSLVALTAFAACSSETTNTLAPTEPTTTTSSVITAGVLYDIPSSICSESPEDQTISLAKSINDSTTDETINLFDFYKPVPIYISIANKAKNVIRESIAKLNETDIPDNFEGAIEDGKYVTIKTIDTLGIKLQKVTIQKDSVKVLVMKYFKNLKGNYKGSFYYNDYADENVGNKVYVHFNGFDDAKKMSIIFKNESGLYGEKHADDEPSAVMLRCIKKGDKVAIKGVSFHPTFTDSFITSGETVPSAYIFKAAANIEKDKGVLMAALVPKNGNLDSVYTKYSLDNVVKNAGVNAFKRELVLNEDLANILLPLMNIESADEINGEVLESFLNAYPQLIANAPELLLFQKFISIKQPIYLDKNARLSGYDSQLKSEEKIMKSADLEDTDLKDIQITEVEDFDMKNGEDTWATK